MDAKDYKDSKILLKVNDNVEVEQKACTAHGFVGVVGFLKKFYKSVLKGVLIHLYISILNAYD